jgi:hypothetical protein
MANAINPPPPTDPPPSPNDKPTLPSPSAAVLEYRELTPEEKALRAKEARRRQEQEEEEELAAEVAWLKKLTEALREVPPEFILAAAIDRHTAAMNRIAAAGEAFVDQVERIASIYGTAEERERSGVT